MAKRLTKGAFAKKTLKMGLIFMNMSINQTLGNKANEKTYF